MALVKYNNNSLSSVTSAAGFPAGALTLIKTITASSDSSISFVDGSSDVVLDSTYPIYNFKFINCHANTDSVGLDLRGSTNSGSSYGVTKTTTSFNTYHAESDSGYTLAYNNNGDLAQSTSGQRIVMYALGNVADENVCGEMYLFNPSSTTFVKHFMIKSIQNDKDNQSDNSFFAGYFNTTSAIDAIKFEITSGTFDGTIKLYGIKGS